jgi:hypothetical protein
MTEAELRAKIRALMASGTLPSDRASIEQHGTNEGARFANPAQEPCVICGEIGPQVALFYTAGRVVRLHAACEALWQQDWQT